MTGIPVLPCDKWQKHTAWVEEQIAKAQAVYNSFRPHVPSPPAREVFFRNDMRRLLEEEENRMHKFFDSCFSLIEKYRKGII